MKPTVIGGLRRHHKASRKPYRPPDRPSVERLEERWLMNAGDLDLSFDSDGKVTTPIGTAAVDEARAIAIQSDGKILTAGRASIAGKFDFAITRYNSDGSLDTSFDGDGKVTTALSTDNDEAYGLAIQPDGKIVVVGRAKVNTKWAFAIARYNSNGTLDTSFDTDGKAITPIITDENEAYGVDIQSDGKIVVAGRAKVNRKWAFAAARYNTNGSLDSSFDADGKLTTAIVSDENEAYAVDIQSDGKIVLAGRAKVGGKWDFALARYNTNGSLDSTFDSDGKTTKPIGTDNDEAYAMAIQTDGKIVLAGRAKIGANFDFALARFNTNGSLDNTFDGDGKVTTTMVIGADEAYAVAIQADGRIVAAGRANTGKFDFALARYNTNGSLDSTFDSDGKVVTHVSADVDEAYAMAIAADGKIVLAGRAKVAGNFDFAVTRYFGTKIDRPPVARFDAYTAAEDQTLSVSAPGLLANDSDPDGDPLTAILVSGPAHGTLFLNSTGLFTYTPNANFNGPDSFTYVANDGSLNSAVATVFITVDPTNDAPIAGADAYSVTEGDSLNITAPGLLANDSDVDGDLLTASLVSAPAHGSLAFNADGSFTYTPDADFDGSDFFRYQANDGVADSNVATVSITVNPVNTAPIATHDNYSVAENQTLGVSVPGVLANDIDIEGDSLTASLISGTTHGVLALNSDGSFSYTPDADYNGLDAFSYRANDGSLDSSLATVFITVGPVNEAPVAINNEYTVVEDNSLSVSAPGVVDNDTDGDDNPLTASLVFGPAYGTLTLNADGSFVYTPTANFNGFDAFIYQANDGSADSNVAMVTITVDSVNDAPIASADAYSTTEDVALNVPALGLLSNDSDVEGTALTAILVSGPGHGALTLNANGSFTYIPNSNFNGFDSFTYYANDGLLSSNEVTVSITVDAVNDAPVANADVYTILEDNSLNLTSPGLLGNDSDVEGNALTASLVSGPTHGTLNLNSDGSLVYTPDADYNGTDSFSYQANDGEQDSNLVTVSITIDPVNDAPIAEDDFYNVAEDSSVSDLDPGVLGNDSDAEGDPITAVLVSGPAHGALTFNADGTFTYTPVANFYGSDEFTYLVNDGSQDSNIATVHITVDAVNDAPAVASDDTYNVDEDPAAPGFTVATPGVLGNDSDVDDDILTATLVSGPTHGVLTLNADGSFTYTPDTNFNGSDSFTYLANDGTADSNVGTVMITVNALNDAPVASNDSYGVDEDNSLTVGAAGVLGNDSDAEGDSTTSVLVSGPAHGVLTLNADGSLSYTPDPDFNGSDSFTYRATDGAADSNIATVTITVNAQSDAPIAGDDGYIVNEDSTLTQAAAGVLGNDLDVDGDSLTAVLVSGPAHGVLTLNANGSLSYTPDADFNGSDSFTYLANDGSTDSNVSTVTITVNAQNDAAAASDDGYSVNEDNVLTVPGSGVLGNDSDLDGASLTAVLVAGPAHGALTLNADGSFSYTPEANFNGSDSFTYAANDGAADSNAATVTITVNALDDSPVAANDGYNVDEDAAAPGLAIAAPGLLGNDADVDGDPLTAVLVAGPAHGALTLNADGSFSYTPDANFNGSDSFTYLANDGTSDSNTATVTITIDAVNDAPGADDDVYDVNEDNTLTVAVSGLLLNDSDLDGDSLTAVLVSGPAHGVLVVNANGSFSYKPAENFNGSDSFTYQANDGTSDSNVATVTITVNALNDAPVATNDSYNVDEDDTLTVTAADGPLGNDSDAEGSPVTAVLVSGPAHGVLSLNLDGSFTYTPSADYFGTDAFTYTATEGAADSNVATVTIAINNVNDSPVADAGPDQEVQGTVADGAMVTLAGQGSDPDGDSISYAWSEGATALSTDATPTLNLSYGVHTLTLSVTDSHGITSSNDVTITVVDTTGPMITDVRFLTTKKSITGLILKADEALEATGAANVNNYGLASAGKDRRFGTADDLAVSISSAVYDAALHTVRLTPAVLMKQGAFYKLSVYGTVGLTDVVGNPLDGDMDGTAGGDCVETIARGTRLRYTDGNGDQVSLKLTGGGALELARAMSGEGMHLRLAQTVPGASALSGKVKKASTGGNSGTTLKLLSGANGVSNRLANPPVQIDHIAAAIVDLLLTSGGI